MITKNEEEMLDGCLKSVAPLADEIIVVDTGSTDDTVAIAQKYGAAVSHSPWQENFSYHRNESLALAQNDWILQIDADERLLTPVDTVQSLLASADAGVAAFNVLIADADRHGNIRSYFRFPRLFRREAKPHYFNRVHNQLDVAGAIADSEIVIMHLGYDLAPEKQQEKSLRTQRLLEQEIADNPENAFAYFNLAFTEAVLQDPVGVIKAGEKCLTLAGDRVRQQTRYLGLLHLLFRAYVIEGQKAKARAILSQLAEIVPAEHLDLLHLRVHAANLEGDHEAVFANADRYLARYSEYLENPQLCADQNIQSLRRRHEVYYWACEAAAATQRWPVFAEYFRHLFDDPGFCEVDAQALLKQLEYAEDDLLMGFLQQVWRRFPRIAFIIATLKIIPISMLDDKALQFLQDEVAPRAEVERSYEAGIFLMLLERYATAAEILLAHQRDERHGENALFLAAQALLEDGQFERAAENLQIIMERFPTNSEARKLYESLYPAVGEVVEQTLTANAEAEETLLQALKMCKRLWQREQYESAVLLLGQIYQVLEPDGQIAINGLEDLPALVGRVETLAVSQEYFALAAATGQLKKTIANLRVVKTK